MTDVNGHPGDFFHLFLLFPTNYMFSFIFLGCKNEMPTLIVLGSISDLSFSVQVCRRTPCATIHRKKSRAHTCHTAAMALIIKFFQQTYAIIYVPD